MCWKYNTILKMKLYYNLTPAFKVFKQSFGSETIQYSNKQHFICVQNYCRHNWNWVNQDCRPWKWIKKIAFYIPFRTWSFISFRNNDSLFLKLISLIFCIFLIPLETHGLSEYSGTKCTTNLIESVQLLVIKNH